MLKRQKRAGPTMPRPMQGRPASARRIGPSIASARPAVGNSSRVGRALGPTLLDKARQRAREGGFATQPRAGPRVDGTARRDADAGDVAHTRRNSPSFQMGGAGPTSDVARRHHR